MKTTTIGLVGLHEHFVALCYHDATLSGWKENSILHALPGDQGQNKIFEDYPSVTPAPLFPNCMVLLLPESFPFQV